VASGADGGGGYLRSCGIADGHPQRGSRQGRAPHDAATGSANTKIQAHSHKDDRTAVVLSGVWYFGYGREFNDAALKELPAGSFYTEPPGAEHFAMTKGPEAIIEITGYGPSATAYVDARNDPAKK
jgi:uncharacterized RmlC-like cupin family protein